MKDPNARALDRLDLMQTFVRIVEAGSLSAAAAQMGSTQPTISRRLQWLERLLGLRLLQRSTHAMRLTEDGERCYAHAKALLENWAAVEADLRGAQDQPRGPLRVLVPHAFGQEALVTPLAQFLVDHPEVSVDWLLQDREANLIAEGIDCAIRVGGVDDPALVAVQLAEVPRILVAPPGLWGTGEPPRAPADLVRLPWVSLPRFYRDELVLHQIGSGRRETVSLTPRLRTDSLYAARSAARYRRACGWCSIRWCANLPSDGAGLPAAVVIHQHLGTALLLAVEIDRHVDQEEAGAAIGKPRAGQQQ